MGDAMTVRAEHHALADLLKDAVPGDAVGRHVGHVEVLALIPFVMEFKNPVICKVTAFTAQSFLVVVKPPADGPSPPLPLAGRG